MTKLLHSDLFKIAYNLYVKALQNYLNTWTNILLQGYT